MKAIITGATGYIGSQLTKRLVKDNWEVHVIIRPKSKLTLLNSIKNEISVHIHNGSTVGMASIIKDSKPHIVFHLASMSLWQHNIEDINPLINSNILFGNQLVEAMIQENIYYLINTGTYWQHYQNKKYNPVCLYAATKQAFWDILKFYIETTKLKVITLELFDTYGPNDPRPKLLNQLSRAIDKKENIRISSGEQLVDIVHINDVVNAYTISAKRLLNNIGQKSEVFSISSGKPLPLKDIVTTHIQILNLKINLDWGGRKYRDREVMKPWNKGAKLPGWEPKINFDEGIKSLINS